MNQPEFEADTCSQCETKNASQNQLLFLATEKNPKTKEFCQNGFSVFHIDFITHTSKAILTGKGSTKITVKS